MTEKHIFCVECRATFSKADVDGHTACPACGSEGIPADMREKHTLELTDHEWRILFMWAANWAETTRQEALGRTIGSIAREARRQQPTLPPLSLVEEVQDVATALGTAAEVVGAGGERTVIEPEAKH